MNGLQNLHTTKRIVRIRCNSRLEENVNHGTTEKIRRVYSFTMTKQAAGLLVYRTDGELEVFLVHPGGPFYSKKDDGVWSIPKGLFEADEDPLTAARREFEEETGQKIAGDFFKLKPITQKGGKIVFAWAVEAVTSLLPAVPQFLQFLFPLIGLVSGMRPRQLSQAFVPILP